MPSCDDDLCLQGGGTVDSFPLELAQFDRVKMKGPVNLRITQGSEQTVTVDAESEIFNELTYDVSSNRLDIGFEGNVNCFETSFGVWVNITLPDLEQVEASGSSEIISNGDIDLDRLEVDISGSGELRLTGTVDEMIIDASGSIVVRNFDLVTTSTFIDISGSGDLEVNCTDLLDIKVSGSATIKYRGNPQIVQNISGTMELIDAN
jgi:hypothetical protein